MKIKLKKGLRLNLAGAMAENSKPIAIPTHTAAVCPDDFPGFVPKVDVKEGDAVACGSPIMHHKDCDDLRLVSPVTGTVKAVVRGERRKVLRIEIEKNNAVAQSPVFNKPSDAPSAKAFLAASGLLALMRMRPFDIVPNPSDEVRDIFVTAFDSAPLAPSYALYDGVFSQDDYQAGIDCLCMATNGKVYISHDASFSHKALKNAILVEFEANYPASNVGVQIANIKPVDKGDIVWTLDFATLGRIGKLINSGKHDFTTVVAVTGPEITAPAAVMTECGAAIEPLLAGRHASTSEHKRIISGNVFTGTAVGLDGYLRYPYRHITVIAEGDDVAEFMGWASMSPSKMSESSSFPSFFSKRAFSPDARLNGGRRAMIVSGQYDRYFPMDILPEYLLKAIISGNIEDMEKLGIYEVAPEDFAAAEYADTSKIPLQAIVREGLDNLRKELE